MSGNYFFKWVLRIKENIIKNPPLKKETCRGRWKDDPHLLHRQHQFQVLILETFFDQTVDIQRKVLLSYPMMQSRDVARRTILCLGADGVRFDNSLRKIIE